MKNKDSKSYPFFFKTRINGGIFVEIKTNPNSKNNL